MSKNNVEPLLAPDDNRFVMFPIQHQDIWQMYQKQIDCFWRPEEIDTSKDMVHWDKLSHDEQHFIKFKKLARFVKHQKWSDKKEQRI